MNLAGIIGAALAVIVFPALQTAQADDGRNGNRNGYQYQFSTPSFSLGFNVPNSDSSSSDLAPLDDDFETERNSQAPRPHTDRAGPQPNRFDDPDDRSVRNRDGDGDGDRNNDRAGDQYYTDRDDPQETLRSPNRLAYCLSDKTVSRNLRAAGWHNFRRYRYTRRKVRVTADNVAGMPFRLTIHRCTGAILFARLL